MARSTARGKKRTIVIALVALFSIAGLGTAFAYWTSSGTGTGTATTGTDTAFIITSQTAVGTATPGGPGSVVGFTVTNPGPGVQRLNAVAVALDSAWDPPEGCLAADYVATITTAPTPGDIAVNGTKTGAATVTLTNTTADQNACKGVDVPLIFTAS